MKQQNNMKQENVNQDTKCHARHFFAFSRGFRNNCGAHKRGAPNAPTFFFLRDFTFKKTLFEKLH